MALTTPTRLTIPPTPATTTPAPMDLREGPRCCIG
jgi:hypothetical protein